MERYSKLALYSTLQAKEDANIAIEEIAENKIGTIFTTGYGPMVSRLEFIRSIYQEDPDLCSPTIFASTVPNSCIGQICINLGCKGVSTMLQGGNSLGLSSLYLKNKRADFIYSGAIEEYCKELSVSFAHNPYAKGVDIQEACVIFSMQREEDSSNPYCLIETYRECDLGGYPLIQEVDYSVAKETIQETMQSLQGHSSIDCIISSESGIEFDKTEKEVLQQEFPNIFIIDKVKGVFGETLGQHFVSMLWWQLYA